MQVSNPNLKPHDLTVLTRTKPDHALSAEEIVKHPEYAKINWDLKPAKSGHLDVAKGRGGPFKIYWELHGSGNIHLVWVMGLGTLSGAWQRQTKDFGHDRGTQYSCLILDNRGIGKSDKPSIRYSTSAMAEDVLELVDHLGWTGKRELHVIGVSMGGMIAQEIAYLAPERIASLSLVSTAARLVNTVGFWENLRSRINMFIPKNIDTQINYAQHLIFSDDWLWQPDEINGAFPYNRDRFAAGEIDKRSDPNRFTRKGFILQAIAAGWHHKSDQQLKQIGDKVGRERIQVLHGTMDHMITPPHGDVLVAGLGGTGAGGVKAVFFEGVGHVISIEKREAFREAIEELVQRTQSMK